MNALTIRKTLIAATAAFAVGLPSEAGAYRPISPVEYLDMEYLSNDLASMLPWWWNVAPPVITVPDDYASIQEAVDASARYDQTILVKESPDDYYHENVTIDASYYDGLTIEGECNYLPEIRSKSSYTPVIEIVNDDNVESTITIRNLTISGASGSDIAGVQVTTSDDPWDAVTTEVILSRLVIRDNTVGVVTGTRTGTYSCSTMNWGSIDETLLEQPITDITVDRCTITGNYTDGMNLWRAQGDILSTIVANNGGEGVHTTHFAGTVRNSVIIGHNDNQFHLHYPQEVYFVNNLVAAGVESGASAGDGLVIGGGELAGDPSVRVYNNVFAANDGAGVRLGFVRLVDETTGCVEQIAASRVRIRNNVLMNNAQAGDRYALHSSHADANLLSGTVQYNLFFDNNDRHYNPAVVSLSTGNIIDVDPLIISTPDADILEALVDAELIRSHAMGVEALVASPLLDAGHPHPGFNDVSVYANGTSRNDIGLFGGPYASPSPLSAGARPTICWPILVDWLRERVFFRAPLYLEAGGDPWADKITFRDPFDKGSFTAYWAPEGIDPRWLGDARDVTNHILGYQDVKLYRTAEERRTLKPVTLEPAFEIKQPRFENDDPIPGK